jgi:hypothetical protein
MSDQRRESVREMLRWRGNSKYQPYWGLFHMWWIEWSRVHRWSHVKSASGPICSLSTLFWLGNLNQILHLVVSDNFVCMFWISVTMTTTFHCSQRRLSRQPPTIQKNLKPIRHRGSSWLLWLCWLFTWLVKLFHPNLKPGPHQSEYRIGTAQCQTA